MNEYIQNRINLERLAITEKCTGDDFDEKYQGALWDWAGEIASLSLDEILRDELQTEIYDALSITFNTLYKPS